MKIGDVVLLGKNEWKIESIAENTVELYLVDLPSRVVLYMTLSLDVVKEILEEQQ